MIYSSPLPLIDERQHRSRMTRNPDGTHRIDTPQGFLATRKEQHYQWGNRPMDSPTDPVRGQGKGSSRNDGDDPAEEFEESADSEAAEDAQQTVKELEQDLENEVPEGEENEGSNAEHGDLGDFEDFEFSESPDSEGNASKKGDIGGDESSSIESFSDTSRFDGQNEITLSKQDLRDESVVRELVGRMNEDARGTGLTEEDAKQIQLLGEDDLTPDVPEHVNLDEGSEFEPLGFSGEQTGASEHAMWLVKTGDGDEMFVTLANSSVVGDPIQSGEIANSFNDSLPEETQDQVGFPDINVDREREASVLEAVGADDSQAVFSYDPSGVEAEFEKDSYLSAVAAKMIVGDTDIGGNIVTSSDGDFHPIDYDLAGSDLERQNERARDEEAGLFGNYDSVWEKVENKASSTTQRFAFEIEDGDVREKAIEIAQEVDVGSLEENLSESSDITRTKRENVLKNVRQLRGGEI